MNSAEGLRAVRATDLARVVGAGLSAALLTAAILTFIELGDEATWGWVLGLAFLAAMLLGFSYRRVPAMAAAGAVMAGMGMVQMVVMHLALSHFEVQPHRFNFVAMVPPTTLTVLGCVLLGAAIAWAVQRSRPAGRWSHYGLGRVLGSLALGAVAAYALARALDVEIRLEGVLQMPVLLLCMIAGVGLGLLPALSPVGLLPGMGLLIALLVAATPGSDWSSSLTVAMIVVLCVLAQFVGPVPESDDPLPDDGRHRGAQSSPPQRV